jgi:hypothetical protein
MSSTLKRTAWTARWSNPTGRRSRLPKCARCSRNFPAGRADSHSLHQPAPVFRCRRGVTRNGATSSSSAITAPCAIAKACSRSIAFSRTCSPAAPRSRASFASAVRRDRNRNRRLDLRGARNARRVSISMRTESPGRRFAPRPRAFRGTGARAPASCRAGFRRAAPQAAPAGRQLYDLCRRKIPIAKMARYLAARPSLARECRRARLRRTGARIAAPVSRSFCRSCPRSSALDPQRSARLQSLLER